MSATETKPSMGGGEPSAGELSPVVGVITPWRSQNGNGNGHTPAELPAPPEPDVPAELPSEPDDLGWKPDDDKLALRLAADLKDKLAYFYSSWRVYEGGCWRARDVYEMRRYIRRELRQYRTHGVNVTQARIKSLASMLEDELFVPDRKLSERQQEQANYINLRNGLFNLETCELEPHRADLYFINQLDFDYDDDAPHSSVFHRYLNSSLVTPDGKTDWSLKNLVLEALAYSLTARTDMKASFWLVGQKDSGKSTFITLIKALMGDLHATIDLTQLATNRFLLAGIVGKRVISFTEASSSTMLPDALYKTLVGGSDEIYADVKNRDGITFRPECKVWWAMNEMPRIGDRSGATTRRIVIIPFNRTIPEAERIPNLEQLLIHDRPAIFSVLVDYLKRLQNTGEFTTCEQSRQMLAEYVMENDTEATFVAERCETHESYSVPAGEFYTAYLSWCEANGFKPKNSNQVAKDWRRLGFEHRRSNGTWWHGVRLKLK